jgi:hypothetical protein
MEKEIMWIGYLHQNGTLHTKRYFDSSDLEEISSSSFTRGITPPFFDKSRDEAFDKVKKYYSVVYSFLNWVDGENGGSRDSGANSYEMGITQIKYSPDEDSLHVWIRRPGLLIGTAGKRINNIQEWIECPILIHEVKTLY